MSLPMTQDKFPTQYTFVIGLPLITSLTPYSLSFFLVLDNTSYGTNYITDNIKSAKNV